MVLPFELFGSVRVFQQSTPFADFGKRSPYFKKWSLLVRNRQFGLTGHVRAARGKVQ